MQRFGTVKIKSYEKGLAFRKGEFAGLLGEGRHWFLNPFAAARVDVVSQRDVWLHHEYLDVIVKSGALTASAVVLDLKDHERGLVWIDGRFDRVVGPGQHVLWNQYRDVRVEVLDARQARFKHESLHAILHSADVAEHLNEFIVEAGWCGVFFQDGQYVETLEPGKYAFWKGAGKVTLHRVDLREIALDVSGQEIMTADKVTLRLNALVTYRVKDARRAVSSFEDMRQALYREAQLQLRAVVGTRDLDAVLADKDSMARSLRELLAERAGALGIEVINLGIRDIILPGDMKELMNKVTEAKKAAEANLIARREETAAMRSQANTAKLLENNPVLVRLRELEVLERIAGHGKLNVVLGEKGLADRMVNLL